MFILASHVLPSSPLSFALVSCFPSFVPYLSSVSSVSGLLAFLPSIVWLSLFHLFFFLHVLESHLFLLLLVSFFFPLLPSLLSWLLAFLPSVVWFSLFYPFSFTHLFPFCFCFFSCLFPFLPFFILCLPFLHCLLICLPTHVSSLHLFTFFYCFLSRLCLICFVSSFPFLSFLISFFAYPPSIVFAHLSSYTCLVYF